MRCWVFSVVVASSLGCYVGPGSSGEDGPGSEAGGSEASGSAASGTPGEGEGPGTTAGPGDPTGASDPTSDTGSPHTSAATDDDGSSGAPADADGGESTGPEMTGCETGPLPAPLPGCAPAPLPSSGDVYQDCVDRINQLRWECQCLPPLERWSDAETCSDEQSSADQNGGGPHANFGMCGENAQNTCPDWGSEQDIIVGCLQSMWDEGPGEPFSEHGHYINMTNPAYSRVACGFSSSGGGVWSNQNFSP